MINFSIVLISIFLIWVFIYTASFGIWTWKKKNKLGAIAVVFIGLISFILPLTLMILRK